MSGALLGSETCRLDALEKIIERGLSNFLAVGKALLEIKERAFYRETHQTFEDYCVGRWKMTRQHANRLISSVHVVNNLEPIGSNSCPEPQTESQARPLGKLPPEQQAEAWQEAVDASPNGNPTASQVKAAVDRRTKPAVDQTQNDQLHRMRIDAEVLEAIHRVMIQEWEDGTVLSEVLLQVIRNGDIPHVRIEY
jgi:hypothetical protein